MPLPTLPASERLRNFLRSKVAPGSYDIPLDNASSGTLSEIPAIANILKAKDKFITENIYNPVQKKYNEVVPESVRPLTDFVLNMVSPVDTDTGLPNLPINKAGLVMKGLTGAKNAQKILAAVEAAKPTNATQAAIAYIRAKYPKLAKMPSDLVEGKKNMFDLFGRLQGDFDPKTAVARIIGYGENKAMDQYVNTGAHEVQHAYQLKQQERIPELIFKGDPAYKNPSDNSSELLGYGKYEPAQLTQKEKDILKADGLTAEEIAKEEQYQYERYLNQPVEVEARKAGSTAQNTFGLFKEHHLPADTNQFDLGQPVTREHLKGFVQDAMFKKYWEDVNLKGLSSDTQELMKSNMRNRLEQLTKQINKLESGKKLSWPVFIDDALGFRVSNEVEDYLKSKGYTSVKRRFSEPMSFLPTIEEKLGLPKPR